MWTLEKGCCEDVVRSDRTSSDVLLLKMFRSVSRCSVGLVLMFISGSAF